MKSYSYLERPDTVTSGRLIRVLLVEDDEDDYVLVRELLEEAQQLRFALTWTDGYEKALQALQAEAFDICLVDYRLGSLTGSDLIRDAGERAGMPPMIMLTGQGGTQSDTEALRAGAADFLEKGRLDRVVLERGIRYALERERAMKELVTRENELRLITDQIDDGLLVVDEAGQVLFTNAAAQGLLNGVEAGRLPAQLRFILQADGPVGGGELALQPAGEAQILEVACKRAEWRGLQVSIVTLHDITSRRQAEEALRASEERYSLAADGANDGLWDWDLKQGRIYLSPRWLDMAGFTECEAFDDPEVWFAHVHPEDLDDMRRAIDKHLEGHTAHLKHTYRLRHKDGDYRWMLCRGRAVNGNDGRPCRMAGSQADITEQKGFEDKLRHDMMHDGLTGLPNQMLFLDRLETLFNIRERQRNLAFAVMFIDLDDFKIINDSLGHVQGDRLLVKVARRLKTCLRPSDSIARLGGDEFALLMMDIAEVSDAVKTAERIQQILDKPFDLEGDEVFISTSIGIAMFKEDYRRAEEMLRDADTAMYRAKHAGKKGHAIFSLDMHQAAAKRLQLETELRRALNEQQLVPYFQPIVDMPSGEITGFETLIRWIHPLRGMISPLDFIPISEQTGLIVPIGEQVLKTACQVRRAWRDHIDQRPDVYVSVNLSPRQLVDDGLPEHFQGILDELGVATRHIRLEITETALMENANKALQVLTRFSDMGFKIYLDDFGTGYSSLSYLHAYPIDVLKIDKSFVDRISHADDMGCKIIDAILHLASSLEIEVVAEGIESLEQLELLRAMGCRYGQGYYFSRPVPADEALGMLLSGQRA